MRTKFDDQLDMLNTELIHMGALIESAIACAVKTLIDRDEEQVQEAIWFDSQIDQKEKEIEALCLKLLLQQQPVASDLRLISAALKMITDMERIGDQANDIAELSTHLVGMPTSERMGKISEMAQATIHMVNRSVEAYVQKDLDLAKKVIDYDDVVDNLFLQIKEELTQQIRENSEHSEYAIDLIMVAKYFERIGDHTTNIAEWVIFSITGQHKTLN